MRRAVRSRAAGFLAVLAFAIAAIALPRAQAPAPAPPPGPAPLTGVDLVRATYTRYQYQVPMRDGARLFTAVYVPKDAAQRYPFLLCARRTAWRLTGSTSTLRRSGRPSTSRRKASSSSTRTRAAATCRRASSSRCGPSIRQGAEGRRREHRRLRHDRVAAEERRESQRARRHDRHLAARLPRGGEHHRLASRPQGGVAAGPDRRLLHGRRRLPQRRLHAGRQLRVLLRLRGARSGAGAAEAGAPLRPRHAGHVRLLPAHTRAAGPDERHPVRRQGGVLPGDRRPHDLRRFLEEAIVVEVHDGREVRGAERRRLVRRRGPGRPAAHLPLGRGEEPRHRQRAGHGAVVARRLVARYRRHARQPELRRPDRRVLPREDPVPVLHAVPEGQAGEPARSLDVPDRHRRVPAARRLAAEEPAADDAVLRRRRRVVADGAGRRRACSTSTSAIPRARCRMSATPRRA